MLGESQRKRIVPAQQAIRRITLLDRDLGPEPIGALPLLAPVRVLRLNKGAIRVKRRSPRRRSDELWVGTGYSESGQDDDVPLYLRIGTARHIVAELVCAVIGSFEACTTVTSLISSGAINADNGHSDVSFFVFLAKSNALATTFTMGM